MTDERTAREQERDAARGSLVPAAPTVAARGEAAKMLVRRGFSPRSAALDLPFAARDEARVGDKLYELLGHYGFRLFLRGAIRHREGFDPTECTKYLDARRAVTFAEALVALSLAERVDDAKYRLLHPPDSFGGTLEWYVARTLRSEYGFDVAEDVKFGAAGVGGDLDLVAAGEGKLVMLELKSSPPKHLHASEVGAFLDRVGALRPHLSLFVMDTALRLADKVLPMFVECARDRGVKLEPERVEHEVFALSKTVYVLNARPDLLLNLGITLAHGFKSLSPDPW
ncbi:MAG: hypothetical protein JNK05_34370 [Myxococcales bacterium]|nr:hypothetical protein [Myxococcales bacterium]